MAFVAASLIRYFWCPCILQEGEYRSSFCSVGSGRLSFSSSFLPFPFFRRKICFTHSHHTPRLRTLLLPRQRSNGKVIEDLGKRGLGDGLIDFEERTIVIRVFCDLRAQTRNHFPAFALFRSPACWYPRPRRDRKASVTTA